MAMKRSGKFYRKNEAEVMRELGLEPTPNSGSGWIVKEDGQNENVICQLKSTDAQSIKLNKQDMDILEYNASVTHKLPVFAIQFLSTNETYLIVKPEVLQEVSEYLSTGRIPDSIAYSLGIDISEHEDLSVKKRKPLKSSSSARERFKEENENKYQKRKRSAT